MKLEYSIYVYDESSVHCWAIREVPTIQHWPACALRFTSMETGERNISIHAMQKSESQASIYSSSSDWGAEHVLDSGIKLPSGTPIYQVSVMDLHPTQLAVGMQQVHEKMNKAAKKREKGSDVLDKFLQNHPVPVVRGPGNQLYLIDHHHLCSALHKLGVEKCYAGTVCDYSELTLEQFWVAMARRNFLWPYKPDGSTASFQELQQMLPETLEGLVDDPYRSLAALVRKAGGYHKSTKPFSEFIWANFLRPRVPMVLMDVSDVEAYVHRGIGHAMHSEAANLPGYCSIETATPEQFNLMSSLGKQELQDD